jgi:hypothetical protein
VKLSTIRGWISDWKAGRNLPAGVEKPSPEEGTARYFVFGYPVTAVLRWMGKAGWSFEDAKKTLATLKVECSEATIKTQLGAGKSGQRGEPAPLTEDQAEQLREAKEGRFKIHGYSPTAVMHWAFQQGWTFEQVREMLDHYGADWIKDESVKTCQSDAKNPKYAKPATLTSEQAAKLNSLLEKVENEDDETGDGGRVKVLGYSCRSVIHWAFQDGWTFEQIRRMLDRSGAAEIKDSTIQTRKNDIRKNPANLSPEQEEQLRSLRDEEQVENEEEEMWEGGRVKIFGFSACSVSYWCAKQGWTEEQIRKMLDRYGATLGPVVKSIIRGAKDPNYNKTKAPPLTPEQVNELNALR